MDSTQEYALALNGRELLVVRERGFVQLTCMAPCSFLSLTIFDNLFSLVLVFLVGCFCFVLILYFPNSCFVFKRTNPNSYKWLLLNFYIWIEDYETGKKKKVRLGISDAWNPSPWEVEIGEPGVHSLGYMRPLFKMRILVSRSKWHCVCFFFSGTYLSSQTQTGVCLSFQVYSQSCGSRKWEV